MRRRSARGAGAADREGPQIRDIIAELFQRHANGILSREVLGNVSLADVNASLRRMERYWNDQIRYIY